MCMVRPYRKSYQAMELGMPRKARTKIEEAGEKRAKAKAVGRRAILGAVAVAF